jgi:hypothetical protein
VGIGHTSPKSKLSIVSDGSVNTYSGVIGIENTASDKWGSITLTDDIDTASASSNYYLIGRGSTYAQRYMSFHVPTAANYGSGSQPKFVFASTGGDELFTLEASTGDAYHKGKVGIGTTGPYFPLHVQGATGFNGEAKNNALLFDTASATTGTGGGIAFGGYTNGTGGDVYHFGNIQGIKENSTAGNYASAMLFSTRAAGATPLERMRISSIGKVAIGTGGAGVSGTHTKLEVHGAIAAGSAQGTGGSLVLYQRYGVNDMPATLSTHYSNSYWLLATGMKARSGAGGYVSSLGNYSTARAGIDINNSSIKFLYVPAATVAVDTVLTPSTPFDMNLDTGTLMLTNGASGTSNGIVFKETNNSDLNKYIKQTAYYLQYNGNSNEGHHFTVSGTQSLLRLHGSTNGTRPNSVDVTATNGLYVNNAQRIESDGTMKPSALEIGVQNLGATLGAYHGKVVHSASNGFTMHQYSKYFESWNATSGVVVDVLETSNDTVNWNGNKSIIIEVRQSSYSGGGYARYYFNHQYSNNSLVTIDASAGANSTTPLNVTALTVVTGNVKKSKVQITLGYYQQAYVTVYSTMTTSSTITAANQIRFL